MPLPRANVSAGVMAGSGCMNTLIRRAPCWGASTPANARTPAVSVWPSMKTTISPISAVLLTVLKEASSGSGDHVDCLLTIAAPPSSHPFTDIGHHLKEILPRSYCANTNRSALSASSIVCNNQFSSSLFTTYSFLHNWRFGLFSVDVLNDVPGVTTARDEFRAFSG